MALNHKFIYKAKKLLGYGDKNIFNLPSGYSRLYANYII